MDFKNKDNSATEKTKRRQGRLFEYAIAETFVNMTRNGLSGFAVITTTAFTLFILWSFIMFAVGANNVTSQEISRFQIAVYLQDEATIEDATKVAEEIQALDTVKEVVLKQKDKEWEIFKVKNPTIEAAGLPADCLPFALSVTPKNPENGIVVADQIRKIKNVSDVLEGREEYKKVIAIAKTIHWLSILCALILFAITAMVIGNAIKLTLYARRKEIYTMQLVGATASFIRIPFVLEGVIFGFLGSVLGFLLIELMNLLVTNKIQMAISMISSYVKPMSVGNVFLCVALCGIIIGFAGSLFSLNKYLKV
ncbi:MAG: ABC transporter permease [Abditibacteriota bacterium]|nr:ABC transporter permease [Abditibacteriota bacterium]